MSGGESNSLPKLDSLRAQLGVDIGDEQLLHALTHSTFAYENGVADNERLEFLGDAVVGQSVTSLLFHAFPDLPEGELAKRRAAIVSTQALAAVAEQVGLGEYLRLGRGEELTEGRKKPSLLADAVEAVIGAVYLAKGAEVAHQVVTRLLGPLVNNPQTFDEVVDPKTAIQEWLAAKQLPPARYEVVGDGPDHRRSFSAALYVDHPDFGASPVGRGEGSSKKSAEIAAAHAALRVLQGR